MLTLTMCAVLASAQIHTTSDPEIRQKQLAIQRLSFMVGNWKGSGWREMEGRKFEFSSSETVTVKENGTVLQIEGKHYAKVGGEDKLVHSAIGLITYDLQKKKYFMNAKLADGKQGDFEVKAFMDRIVWSIKVDDKPEIVYESKFKDSLWTETGTITKDRKPVKIFEMNLRRQDRGAPAISD